jgi:hypothetical protein
MPKVATPKKAVAKKVVKKTDIKKPTKKVASASSAKSLVYAEDKLSFWVADGQILNSLVALQTAFGHMTKPTFAHHVSKDKNDFADWVQAVLGDPVCADDLRKVKTLASAKTTVTKHLKKYAL